MTSWRPENDDPDEDEDEEDDDEIDIESIDDEQTLQDLLDETDDIDERKRIRDKLKKVKFEKRMEREKQRQLRENEGEERIQKRQKEANERKKQILEMYNDRAKAGTERISNGSRSNSLTGTACRPVDLVEEAIRERKKAADDRKKRILAAFDHAARTQPAGQPRIVEFDAFRSADVSKLDIPKPVKGSCTFSMSGGVPTTPKAAIPALASPKKPVDESELDPMERAIRARAREAEEKKRRTLAAYDMAARTGGPGPKVVNLEDFKDLEISETKKTPKYDPCFQGFKT